MGSNPAKDPDTLNTAKRQVIEETLALQQAPRVILQTYPLEHSPIARNSAIDLQGWAEPGTLQTQPSVRQISSAIGLFLSNYPEFG